MFLEYWIFFLNFLFYVVCKCVVLKGDSPRVGTSTFYASFDDNGMFLNVIFFLTT